MPFVARLSERVLDVLLRSSLFVALCAVALCWETTLLAHVTPRPAAFYGFIFCATWASYRLHAIVMRRRWDATLTPRAIAGELAFPLVGTAVLLPFGLRWDDVPAVIVSTMLASLYSIRPAPSVRPLREYGVLKIAILAGVWTLTTAYLPAVGVAPSTMAYLCLRRFAFMFALCVAFDIRDASSDERGGIRTVAVRLGLRGSYTLIRTTLLAFVALVAIGPFMGAEPFSLRAMLALLASAGITWLAVEFTRRPTTTSRFYLACIDGMMLLQCVLVSAVVRGGR